MLKLTPAQLALLRRLPDSPSDGGLRCVGGRKVTAHKLVALGLAKRVGERFNAAWFARTTEGRLLVDLALAACPECGGDLGGTDVGRLEEHRTGCSRFPL